MPAGAHWEQRPMAAASPPIRWRLAWTPVGIGSCGRPAENRSIWWGRISHPGAYSGGHLKAPPWYNFRMAIRELAGLGLLVSGAALFAQPLLAPPPLTEAERTALAYTRSEEHTSELQSLRHLVCRL